MRLWHEALLRYLSTKRLVRQHCECCALRGKGWGRKHATVDYVFKHAPEKLFVYHCFVMDEMERRGFSYDKRWQKPTYRGKELPPWTFREFKHPHDYNVYSYTFPEHDDEYLRFCLKRLDEKGEHIPWND